MVNSVNIKKSKLSCLRLGSSTKLGTFKMSLLIQQAKSLAIQLHAEQTDKAGKPYAHHLKAVTDALIGNSDEVIITGWLHDSVEDTGITLDEISSLFGESVAKAVDAITKRKGESYSEYLNRVKANSIARLVKIADLSHNMDLSRLLKITEKDLARREKYINAKEFLENASIHTRSLTKAEIESLRQSKRDAYYQMMKL